MRNLLIVIVLLNTGASFAALPPFYQSVREIEAIVTAPELGKKLEAGGSISSISKNGTSYMVVAGDCAVNVGIKSMPADPKLIGPKKFKVVIGEVVCTPN